MSDWFQQHREEWVLEMARIYGYVNRVHLCRKFDISTAQASVDLKRVQEQHPDVITYNASTKRYEAL